MSDQPQRAFSTAFKEQVVLRLRAGERLAAVADELGIRRKLLYEWRHAYRKHGVAGLNRKRGPKPGSKGSGSPPGRASPGRRAARRRTGSGQSAHRGAGARDRPAAGRSRFFSQSLAAHGRGAPERHRAHIYAAVEAMTTLGS